jgi:hypothetical protein
MIIGGSVAVRIARKLQKYKKAYTERTDTINKIHGGRDNRLLKEEAINGQRNKNR